MKTQTWSYQDEVFARGVHIVPDFEPVPERYETLVLLGPEPLTLWELLAGFATVLLFLGSACSVVALLWCLMRWLARVI